MTFDPTAGQSRTLPLSSAGGFPTVEGDVNHFVLRPCPWAGGVSDRGLVHATNQDSLAIAAGSDAQARPVAALAVSDGVSTSAHSAEAARLAATEAADHLADALQQDVFSLVDLGSRMQEAFVRANDAILAAAHGSPTGSWACTLVIAAWWRRRIVVGNVGDSRAYWVPRQGEGKLMSTDDSLAQARIELGIAREVAETGAQAHAILKWLGPGSGDPEPTLRAIDPRGPGWLVVCSDGLWNYASDPPDFDRVVRTCAERLGGRATTAWELAQCLTDWAKAQGGRDNVTAAVLAVEA